MFVVCRVNCHCDCYSVSGPFVCLDRYLEHPTDLLPSAGWSAPTMAADLTTLPLTASINIPAIATSFFPGATPYSKLVGG